MDELKREGIIISKWDAAPDRLPQRFYDVSIRGQHVCGNAVNAPLRVRNVRSGVEVSLLGLQVPSAVPQVTVGAGGGVSGRVQVAVRKQRRGDGSFCSSDLSPLWPAAAENFGHSGAADTERALDGTGGTAVRLGQSFTVPSQEGGVEVSGSFVELSGVELLLRRSGDFPAGTIVQVQLLDVASNLPNRAVSGLSFGVDANSIPTAGDWSVARTAFSFGAGMLVERGRRYALVLSGSYGNGSPKIEWGAVAGGGGLADEAGYRDNGGTWAAYAGPAVDFLFLFLGGGDERAHGNYAELSDGVLTVNNLDAFARDAEYENYDMIEVCIASDVSGGDFLPAFAVPVTDALANPVRSFNQGLETLLGQQAAIPSFNRPFGAVKQMVGLKTATSERLMAFGKPGWDNWRDPVSIVRTGVQYLVRDEDLDRWVLGMWVGDTWQQGLQGVPDPGNFQGRNLNGYCLLFFRDPGRPVAALPDRYLPLGSRVVMRGLLEVVVVGGIAKAVLRDERGEVRTWDSGDVRDSMIRAEVRRRVLASVTTGSSRVRLTYADDDSGGAFGPWNGDGTPAPVAMLGWNGHVLRVGESGFGTVLRVVPRPECTPPLPVRPVPWKGRTHFPSSEVLLEEPWSGKNATEQLELEEDDRLLMVGGGLNNTWEGTGQRLSVKLTGSENGIAGIGFVNGRPVAVMKARQMVAMEVDGIVEPETRAEAIGYALDQQLEMVTRKFPLSCMGWPTMFTDSFGNLGWVGQEGIYYTNLQQTRLISADSISERFRGFDRESFHNVSAAFDAGHAQSPAVRICGFCVENAYRSLGPRLVFIRDLEAADDGGGRWVWWSDLRLRRNLQMLYFPERERWGNLSDFGEVDAICTVLSEEGELRCLAGADGHLWLYGSPARPGKRDRRDVFTLGRIEEVSLWARNVPGTCFRSVEDGDELDGMLLRWEDAPEVASRAYLAEAGWIVGKIGADGEWELGELLFATAVTAEGVMMLVRPVTPWTRAAEASYDVILGPRPFVLALPTMVPPAGAMAVVLERMRLDIEDNNLEGEFLWPLKVELFSSRGGPSLVDRETLLLGRPGTRELRWETYVMSQELSRESLVRISGIAPPTSHLWFKGIELAFRVHGVQGRKG